MDARDPRLRLEPRSGLGGAAGFVALGVEHILGGWDHLAFVLALLLGAGGLRQIIRLVTAFTVGHGVTLALATLGVASLPAGLVEPVIAASVTVAALGNLLDRRRAGAPARRWPLALLFGLVHGFGFAGALAELELPRAGLATALLAFNLGVELGQAAVIAAALPLLSLLRRRPRLARAGEPAGSAVVGCAGLLWLVGRLPW